jgi:glycosyltransferase involved in cell wall biosynthesis
MLYNAAKRIGDQTPPRVIYSYQPWLSFAAHALSKRYAGVSVKRIFGTWLYKKWYNYSNIWEKIGCLPHFFVWIWPFDLMVLSNDGTEGGKIAELLRIHKSRYIMLINGVEKDWVNTASNSELARKEYGLLPDDFVLLCLSRLSVWKRQDRVIRSMPEILKSIPNAVLVLAGDGPKHKELEKLAESLGVGHRVRFLGMVLHSKVKDVMGIADVFLQTNDLSCLGNTLLEALCCGRTIVTWDVGGTRDIITDDVNGILLPDAEPTSLAEAVIRLFRDKDGRQRLAQNAKAFAQEKLMSWNERIDLEINLIEERTRPRG